MKKKLMILFLVFYVLFFSGCWGGLFYPYDAYFISKSAIEVSYSGNFNNVDVYLKLNNNDKKYGVSVSNNSFKGVLTITLEKEISDNDTAILVFEGDDIYYVNVSREKL